MVWTYEWDIRQTGTKAYYTNIQNKLHALEQIN